MIFLFSQSGSVIGNILGNSPGILSKTDCIITNNHKSETWDKNLIKICEEKGIAIHYLKHKEIEEKLLDTVRPITIVLSGYLRLLSGEVCKKHNIYNLHPFDIVRFPEYKGKDPLERFFSQYETYGKSTFNLANVIHKVIEQVDEGQVLDISRYTASTLQEAQAKSREVAVKQWVSFLEKL